MRAIAVDKLKGEPRLMVVPKPEPNENQILVQVAAAGINPFDWMLADGYFEGVMPNVLPFVLGSDAVGMVVAAGRSVTQFKVGDRVFGQFLHAPLGQGTYADYALAPAEGAIALAPSAISDAVAAALPTAAMTALAIVDAIRLPAGATVLVVGATGGVGSFTTQLAALKKFFVLATGGRTDEARLSGYGVQEVYDHHKGSIAAAVAMAHSKGLDALIDLVSPADKVGTLMALVKKGGYAYSTVGALSLEDMEARGLDGGNFVLEAKASLIEQLAHLIAGGVLQVPVESIVSLDEVPAALARARGGGARGKTVILL